MGSINYQRQSMSVSFWSEQKPVPEPVSTPYRDNGAISAEKTSPEYPAAHCPGMKSDFYDFTTLRFTLHSPNRLKWLFIDAFLWRDPFLMDLPRIFTNRSPKKKRKKFQREKKYIYKYAGYSLIPAGHSRQDISIERVRCVGVRTPLGVANPLPVHPFSSSGFWETFGYEVWWKFAKRNKWKVREKPPEIEHVFAVKGATMSWLFTFQIYVHTCTYILNLESRKRGIWWVDMCRPLSPVKSDLGDLDLMYINMIIIEHWGQDLSLVSSSTVADAN